MAGEGATLAFLTDKTGDRIGRYKLLQQIGEVGCDLLTAGARVSLSWKDNSNNENGFLIERKNGNAWQTLATTAPITTTFVDVTAARRTTDGYRGAPTPTCRRHLDDSPSKETPDPC